MSSTNETTITRAPPKLRALIRERAPLIAAGSINDAQSAAFAFSDAGAVRNNNLGIANGSMVDGDDACVAWFAGQFIDIVATESWFAVNAWLNTVDRFCPAVSP